MQLNDVRQVAQVMHALHAVQPEYIRIVIDKHNLVYNSPGSWSLSLLNMHSTPDSWILSWNLLTMSCNLLLQLQKIKYLWYYIIYIMSVWSWASCTIDNIIIGKRIREIISIIVFAVLSTIALMKLAESTNSPFNSVTASSLIVATSMFLISILYSRLL